MSTELNDVRFLGDKILVKSMEFGLATTSGGVLIPDDEMKLHGARPRWCQIIAIGKDVENVKVGQYVLMEHGRWTRGFEMTQGGERITARMIDNNDMLLVADEPTVEYSRSEKI